SSHHAPRRVASQKKNARPEGESAGLAPQLLQFYRSSASRPAEAATEGFTTTRFPLNTQARWLGEKRGASKPSLISRVTAKRLNESGDRNNRWLSGKPSVGVSASPTTAEMIPSPFGSTL